MVDPFTSVIAAAVADSGQPSSAVSSDLIKRTQAAVEANALVPVLSNLRTLAVLDQEVRQLDRLFHKLADWSFAGKILAAAESGIFDESPLLRVYLACLNLPIGYEATRIGLEALLRSPTCGGPTSLPRSVRNGIEGLPPAEDLDRVWPDTETKLKLEGSILRDCARPSAFYTITDPVFLSTFGDSYMGSLSQHYPDALLHIALVNPTADAIALLQQLADRHGICLTFSFEECNGHLPSFCINQRNVLLPRVAHLVSSIQSSIERLVLTDIDCVFRAGLLELVDQEDSFDVGIVSGQRRRGYFLPWSRIDGNFLCISLGDGGRTFANKLSALTTSRFDPSQDQVFYDQSILFAMVAAESQGGSGFRVKILNRADELRASYWQASGYDGNLDLKLSKLLGTDRPIVSNETAHAVGQAAD
jgi:hypothetical protein